jgi:hypothetical protein
LAAIPDVSFLVIQEGLTLYFYRLANGDVSPGKQSFTINLFDHVKSGLLVYEQCPVSMTSGKGVLFVVGEKFEPFYIEYDADANTISATRIYIQIRDFKGVNDGLANEEEPTTLTDEHHYNLKNQGWTDSFFTTGSDTITYYDEYGNQQTYTTNNSSGFSPIDTYFTANSRYPGNNKLWWAGKKTDGTEDFDPTLLDKYYAGSSHAPRGHYVVDAFNIDRSAVSGVPNIPIESSNYRPVSVAFFSGRSFYLTHGTVYFSQILDDKRKAGFCYQEADPTSEDISDLIASDGGVIPIPEMVRAVKMISVGGGLLCFGTNGVWFISGTSSGFTATDISVTKVSPIGTISPHSIVQAELEVYWWSYTGIMSMSQQMGVFGPINDRFDKTNITQTTIQTYFNQVNNVQWVKGCYNPELNVIQWMTNSSPLTSGDYFYNRVLNYDLTLKAFYPWTINVGNDNWMIGIFRHPITRITNFITATSSSTNYKISFGKFDDDNYADWRRLDGTGQTYPSYVETGMSFLKTLCVRRKPTTFSVTSGVLRMNMPQMVVVVTLYRTLALVPSRCDGIGPALQCPINGPER